MDTRQIPRHFQTFRLADSPNMQIKGFFHEPPVTASMSVNPPRLLQVSERVLPETVLGKMLISATRVPSRHLVSEFMMAQDSYIFKTYEATQFLTMYRESIVNHPVTKMPIKDPNPLVQERWFNVGLVNIGPSGSSGNPVSEYQIRSHEELKERDLIGPFIVKQVVIENGLYLARAEHHGS